VYFFSLDAGSRIAVEGARRLYHLPYYKARMQARERTDGGTEYESVRSDRRAPDAVFRATYGPAGPLDLPRPGSVERWLVERYCLYAVERDGRVTRTEIHHRPWQVGKAWCNVDENTVPRAAMLGDLGEPDLLALTAPLDVAVWWPERVYPQT
jgi:uncharacterized protein YqjF (DUF2071 family)